MNVTLISFKSSLTNKIKQQLILDVINNSLSDLILFPGHTLTKLSHLTEIAKKITNTNCTAFLEVKEIPVAKSVNWSFKIANGKVYNNYTNQVCIQSEDFNIYPDCAEHLFNIVSTSRIHKVNGKRVLILMCGELNILKNNMNNRTVSYRTSSPVLEKKYRTLFNSIDIVLNPIHSRMGNQGKLKIRREFLSQGGKAYFSTSNYDNASGAANQHSLQYAYYDGIPIAALYKRNTDSLLVREFEI